jgi:hypothetical protein
MWFYFFIGVFLRAVNSCPVTQGSQAALYPPMFPQRLLMELVNSKYIASNNDRKPIIHSEQVATCLLIWDSEMVNAKQRLF